MTQQRFANRTYAVIHTDDKHLINYEAIVHENELELLRSDDSTQLIIKWENTTPSFISSFASSVAYFDHQSILSFLDGHVKWSNTVLTRDL